MKCIRMACAGVGVLLASASAAQADFIYTGPANGSWYNAANWADNSTDPNTAGVLPGTGTTNVNTSTVGGGVIFDPAVQNPSNQTYSVTRLYIGSNNSGPGSGDTEFAGQSQTPNTLTVNSGTLNTGDQFHIGRHHPGTLVMNGGTVNATDFRMTDTVASDATLDYRGGVFFSSGNIRMAKGTGSSSTIVVGHSDNGRFATGNHFVMSEATSGTVTSIVEFHYEAGGVQTIEVAGQLSLRNGAGDGVATKSARLDLVLDEAPLVDSVDNTVADLPLFATGSGTTSNNGGTALFRDIGNTDYYEEGDIISATFGGQSYQWAITYTGNIVMDGTTGNVATFTGPGTGNDVILIGQPVPEPGGVVLLGAGAVAALRRRRRAG